MIAVSRMATYFICFLLCIVRLIEGSENFSILIQCLLIWQKGWHSIGNFFLHAFNSTKKLPSVRCPCFFMVVFQAFKPLDCNGQVLNLLCCLNDKFCCTMRNGHVSWLKMLLEVCLFIYHPMDTLSWKVVIILIIYA